MRYNWYRSGSPHSRLRKRKKGGLTIAPYQGVYPRHNSLKVYHSTVDKYRNEGPLWRRLRHACCRYKLRTKSRNSAFKKGFAVVKKYQGSKNKIQASIPVSH